MNENSSKLELAKTWLRAAGQYLRQHIHEQPEITEKTRYDDLVTNFDKKIQEQIVCQILQNFPNDEILAEEEGKNSVKFDRNKNFWVLDPIDGTTNFIAQKDNFAIMLAYYERGVGQFGLILEVMSDKLYWCDATNAYCETRQLSTPSAPLSLSLLAVNSYMYRANVHGLLDLSRKTLGVRITGSAGISYIALLEGKVAAYFSNLYPWDYAAGSIIAARLGYVTQKFDGQAPTFSGREQLYTAPSALLEEIQAYIV